MRIRSFIFAVTIGLAPIGVHADPGPAKVDNPRTVVVGEKSVVDIYLSQFQDTLIVLPAAEKVRQTFVGDSANWVLTTGKSDEPTRYISVKVKDPIVKQTTVNVLSDHDKSYTFRLILSADHCDSKIFIDPDSQLSQELAKPPVFVAAAELERVKKEAADAKSCLRPGRRNASRLKPKQTQSPSGRNIPPASSLITGGTRRWETSLVSFRSSAMRSSPISPPNRRRRPRSMS